MKIASRFALLLAALAALAVAAPSAFATTVTAGDGTGNFNGTGSGRLDPDTFGGSNTIDCNAGFVTEDPDGDGVGNTLVTFNNCTTSDGTTSCTVEDASSAGEITGTGGVGATVDTYTLTDDLNQHVDCNSILGPTCDVFVTASNTPSTTSGVNTSAGGTIDDSATTVTLTGRGDSTSSLCTGVLTGNGTIVQTIEITA